MFIFALLELAQKAHDIRHYIGWYRHPFVPFFVLEEESGKLQVVFVPQGDLKYKVSNVGNEIYPTRSPDELAQILTLSIIENLDLFHAIKSLCISGHRGTWWDKSHYQRC